MDQATVFASSRGVPVWGLERYDINVHHPRLFAECHGGDWVPLPCCDINATSASVVDRVTQFTGAAAVTSVSRRRRGAEAVQMLVGLVGEFIMM